MPSRSRDLQRYQDGFAIFALSVVVFSLVATTALLIWQVSVAPGPETVALAPVEMRVRTN